MPAKVYGEFSIELDPHYHLIQALPGDSNVYAAGSIAAEKVLSVPDNEIERRFRFDGIPANNAVVTPDFAEAIPGTRFSGYDVSVPERAKAGGLQAIELELRDIDNPNRVIKLKTELGADDTGDLVVHDNYPDRQDKSAKTIGREAVRNFLAWQLQALGQEGAAFELASEQQLAMLLGQYARDQRHSIRTGETQLSNNRILHAEREEVYEIGNSGGEPMRTTHSVWITEVLGAKVVKLGSSFRARTIARLDATNFWHPGNSLAYEVEASEVDEDNAEELTKQVILLQRNKKLQTARAFTACLGDYLRSERPE